MSKLSRAIEILEAINEHFQEHDGQTVLYSDAQILDGETSIKDAIAECLGHEEVEAPIVPRSKRPRLNHNVFGGWSGWIGKRKILHFDNEEEAKKWLKSQEYLI